MFWALLPLVVTVAPSIIRGVESIFSHRSKSGSDKLVAAKSVFSALLQVAGHVDVHGLDSAKAQELDTLLTTVINVLVADMNNRGELNHALPA